MRQADAPEFTAATLPLPQQWEGKRVWRSDLRCFQFSDGRNWVSDSTGVPITAAELSGSGQAGVIYELTDGPNRGAKLAWAIPEGESTPTWCWWLWPQSAYTA